MTDADLILAECRDQAIAEGFTEPSEIMAYTAGRLAQRLAYMQMQISDLRREVTA